MYLAISTRPDILHSVSKLSQRNTDPHVEHEAGVKHVLRYLKKTVNWKLNYMKSNKAIEGFADADWGSDPSDRKSYSGYAFVLAGGVFSWESKKQSVVALSSTETEYLALSAAAKEAAYINKLLKEMGFGQSGPTVINNDNLSSQSLVKSPTYHARSKHIDIKFHHIRQMYSNKEIDLSYISTNNMMSDMLTKNLHKSKHVKFSKEMGIF
ncbi:uncharacterized protein LOC128870094 [Anastrepha ludens]|uniref:uncharacterized protein LOC128870093 n=1 Tax=Anastrepha ludens TaxID=28586 RepID=UPI0023B17C47|nr:uncharacterized protein LOC128870093 [Anastrepha ludens]XP_053968668.1 uncharacterized protein LOC128870094 [Anastrepha ludens]